MASLPYRIARRACVHDEEIHLLVKFKLEFCPDSVLVLHFFSVDHRMPGRYQTNEKLCIERDCSSEVFIQYCMLSLGSFRRSPPSGKFCQVI